MKTYDEINQRIENMENYRYSDSLVRIYGTEKEFDANFLYGFMRGLQHVLKERLDESHIRQNYSYLKETPEQTKSILGERNAYAWCLDWNTQ